MCDITNILAIVFRTQQQQQSTSNGGQIEATRTNCAECERLADKHNSLHRSMTHVLQIMNEQPCQLPFLQALLQDQQKQGVEVPKCAKCTKQEKMLLKGDYCTYD